MVNFEASSIEFEDILRFDDIPHSKFIYIGRKCVKLPNGHSRYEYWLWDSGFSPEPTVYWTAAGVENLIRQALNQYSDAVHYSSRKVLKSAFRILKLSK